MALTEHESLFGKKIFRKELREIDFKNEVIHTIYIFNSIDNLPFETAQKCAVKHMRETIKTLRRIRGVSDTTLQHCQRISKAIESLTEEEYNNA
jgi:hypothetical protein